jgi:hypothetical protein
MSVIDQRVSPYSDGPLNLLVCTIGMAYSSAIHHQQLFQ